MREEIVSRRLLIWITKFRKYSWVAFDLIDLYPARLTEEAFRDLWETLRAFRASHKAASRRISASAGYVHTTVFDIPMRFTKSLLETVKSIVLDKANWEGYGLYRR